MSPPLIESLLERLSPPGAPSPIRRSVSGEELTAILAAARVAPSADNLQTWRFLVVRSLEGRRRLAAAVAEALRPSVEAAAVVVLACGVKAMVTRIRREQPFVLIDVPIAVTHILLQAAELELPCAWTLELDETRCRAAAGIPDEVRVIALIALG